MDTPSPPVGGSRRKRQRRDAELSDDEDGPTPSSSAKRARRPVLSDAEELDASMADNRSMRVKKEKVIRARGGDDDGDDSDDDEDDEIQRPEGRVGLRPDLERGDDGFVSGAVVRLKLRNFMTYSSVEFRPGPYLNMIIGPNGTGKSTISSAIALGLGWNPKVMARGDDLRSFVKQGEEWAETEIELKGKRGKKNLLIYRKFTREHENEWKVNNEPSTRKAVTALVKGLGVEEANLCSFLPQDMVASFAKMQPNFLLRQTMLAAGDPRLSKWYEQLCVDGKELTTVEETLREAVEKRDTIQGNVDTLEPDLRNYRTRQEQEMEREVLELLVLTAEGQEIKKQHLEAKKEKSGYAEQIKAANSRRQPLLDLQKDQRDRGDDAIKSVRSYNHRLKGLQDGWKENSKKIDSITDKEQAAGLELDALTKKAERLEVKKAELKRSIAATQKKVDTPVQDEEEQLAAKRATRIALRTRYREEYDKIIPLQNQVNEHTDKLAQMNEEINQRLSKQREVQNVEKQREKNARDLDPSIGFALDWLAEHSGELEKKVCLPPMMSVNITDPRYAWQVEICTSLSQRKTFICQTPGDYERMLRLNNTEVPARRDGHPRFRVALQLALVDVTPASLNPKRPCNPDLLANLGMDGYAIDFVEAEPAVVAFLCDGPRLHATALTQRRSAEINTDRLVAAGITKYVTSTEFVTANKSLYGRQEFQISTRPPVIARGFAHAVDQEALTRIGEEIGNFRREIQRYEGPFNKLKKASDSSRAIAEATKAEVTNIETEIARLQSVLTAAQKAHMDLENLKRKLVELESEPTQDAERVRIKGKLLGLSKSRIGPLKAYHQLCEDSLGLSNKAVIATLKSCQYDANNVEIAKHIEDSNQGIDNLQRSLDLATEVLTKLRAAYTALTKRVTDRLAITARSVKNAVTARTKEGMVQSSVEELRAQLENVIADLEASGHVHHDVVRKYDEMVAKLESAKKLVETTEQSRKAIKDRVNGTLSRFNPCLDTLIEVVSANFSAAFERLKCSGEVKIHRVENHFEYWGIEIRVSYRDTDSLQILTANHQSGGERSLATVTYLMSLSEMARTPFSLVDEINQGMDQRAEKNVHEMLVETTCSDRAGQYFLITPKLLPGLNYHERMKILVINNGTWIPEAKDASQRYGSLKSCLEKYKRQHKIAV